MLETHWDKPRVYIGCMKSGEVFSDSWVSITIPFQKLIVLFFVCLEFCIVVWQINLSASFKTEPTSGMNQTGGNLVMGNRKYACLSYISSPITCIVCTRFNMQINYCCDSSISIYQNNRYFRHASGEMFVISRAVAQFISINRFATLYCA